MAKVGSGLLSNLGKAKKGNSLVRRTNAFIGRKIGRKGRTIAKKFGDINKTTARGKNNLLNVPKQLELPLNADTPIKKPSIARMARNEVKSFISGAADKIEQQVESFDPKKFLSKIFDGGLNKLTDFGNSLDRMANSGQIEFLERANRLATEFVEKLASGKGGGGFMRVVGNILKIAAGIGVAALAAPFVGPVLGAVATVGAITGGVVLAAKGISDFVRGKGLFKGRKEKVKKKKEEDKFAKINESLAKCITLLETKDVEKITKEDDQKLAKGESTFDASEGVMGGITSSDATIEITDDGKIIITRKESSSKSYKAKFNTKDATPKQQLIMDLEKELATAEGRSLTDGNNEKGYIDQEFMIDEALENLRFDEKNNNFGGYDYLQEFLKKQGITTTEGAKGDKGFRGSRGLPGTNLEASAMNINEKGGDFALAPPAVKFMNVVNAAKDFFLGKPTETAQKPNVPGSGFSELEVDPSKIEASTEESDLRYEASKDISSQPNKSVASASTPRVIDMTKSQASGTDTSGERPRVPTMSKTGNKVPILVPIDITNIHVPYTKSVFNIVDTN